MDETGSGEPTKGLNVYDVIQVMCDQMAGIAWQKLGLQPDLLSGELKLDLEQAKVAIDLTTHLASFIQPLLDEGDKAQLQGLIRDLRLNYVEKAKGANH
jgi:hypothetical protein